MKICGIDLYLNRWKRAAYLMFPGNVMSEKDLIYVEGSSVFIQINVDK